MKDSGLVNWQRRTRNEYEHFSARRWMAILIPKILRYSFIQAPNDKCVEFGCLGRPWGLWPQLDRLAPSHGVKIRDSGFGMVIGG